MTKRSWTIVSLLIGVGAVSCGALGGGPQNEGEFCVEYAKAECEKLPPICGFPAPTDCQAARKQACSSFVALVKGGGQRAFRPDNVDECIDKVKTTYAKPLITSDDLNALDKVCARIFAGHAKANEACSIDQDCDGQLICDKTRCGPLRIVAAGANCGNPGEVCSKGEFCRPDVGFSVCAKQQDKGMTCNVSQPCMPQYRCAEGGSCVDGMPLMAPCSTDGDCASGYCDPYPLTGMPRTCAPGLSFAFNTPSCQVYFGKRAAGEM
jgi:hypothetical protein